MKNRLLLGFILIGLIGIGAGVYLCWNQPKDFKTSQKLWLSSRPFPTKISLDAYLKGNEARKNQDLETAVQSYLKVL